MENNNNIIGPFDAGDWYLLKMLKKNIAFYRKDPDRFNIAMKKERKLYTDIISGKEAA